MPYVEIVVALKKDGVDGEALDPKFKLRFR